MTDVAARRPSLMDSIARFARTRPALAVLAANIVEDLVEAFPDLEGSLSVSARVMDIDEMRDALALPWNVEPADVASQITVEVMAPTARCSIILARVTASYHVLEIAERPTRRGGARRHAVKCLVPTHLAPRNWSAVQDRPVAFVVDVVTDK